MERLPAELGRHDGHAGIGEGPASPTHSLLQRVNTVDIEEELKANAGAELPSKRVGVVSCLMVDERT